MILERLTVGPLRTNCYVLGCQRSRDAAVIDPGGDPGDVVGALRRHGLTARWLVNTHGHFDHVGGNRTLREVTGAALVAHARDAFLLGCAAAAAAEFGVWAEDSPPPDLLLDDGAILEIGDHRLRCIHTPGHSPGGICLYCEREGLLFTGDTLFNGAIGRVDLPGAFHADLIRSIRERVFTLPDAVRVLPGHGPASTVGLERDTNLCVPKGDLGR